MNNSVKKFLKEIGAKGGKVKSLKKTLSCRLNGAKGGKKKGENYLKKKENKDERLYSKHSRPDSK